MTTKTPDYEVTRWECHRCGSPNDRAKAVTMDSPPPQEGDIAVCARCGFVHVFDELGLTVPWTEEHRKRWSYWEDDLALIARMKFIAETHWVEEGKPLYHQRKGK